MEWATCGLGAPFRFEHPFGVPSTCRWVSLRGRNGAGDYASEIRCATYSSERDATWIRFDVAYSSHIEPFAGAGVLRLHWCSFLLSNPLCAELRTSGLQGKRSMHSDSSLASQARRLALATQHNKLQTQYNDTTTLQPTCCNTSQNVATRVETSCRPRLQPTAAPDYARVCASRRWVATCNPAEHVLHFGLFARDSKLTDSER